jgi:TonB family protein
MRECAVMDPAGDSAIHDDLTGALNRRFLRRLFADDWPRLLAEHGSVAVLLLDLDLFKQVNDRHGHLVGDAVLRQAAERLRASFREHDRVVRYGGDEFVIVLPGADADEARELAVRVRRVLFGEPWRTPDGVRPLGVALAFSIGAAAAPADGTSGEQVLEVADRRLYDDKRRRHERRRRRQRWIAAVAVALVAGGLGYAVRRVLSSPPPPAVGAPAARTAPAVEPAEVESLRGEVERLRAALAVERSSAERDAYEARIAELERTLAEARSRAESERRVERERAGVDAIVPAARPQPAADPDEAGPAATAAEPAGTRRQREPSAPAPQPAVRTPPELVGHDEPVYPLLARRLRVGGTVELRLDIDAGGRVTTVRQSGPPLGYGLDEAARRAALSARYRPALRDGVPVAGEALLQIRFVADD